MRVTYQPPERPRKWQEQDALKNKEEYQRSVRLLWFVGAIIVLLVAFRNYFLN